MGMDAAMRAQFAAGADRAVMLQNAMSADFSTRPNENKGTDFAAGTNHRIWRNHRAWVNAGFGLHGRMKKPRDFDEFGLR